MNHTSSFAMKIIAALTFSLTLAGLLPVAVAQQVIPNPYVGVTNDNFLRVTLINGIVIVSSLNDFNPDGVPLVGAVTVKDLPLLKNYEFTRLVEQYLGRPLDDSKMRELQREIILYYRAHDRPLVDVVYPEQDVSNGMLQVVVVEGRLKGLKIQDARGNPYTNGWISPQFMFDSIKLRTNDVISQKTVDENLGWLNRNPFRRIEAVYEPDRRNYGETSLLLRVDDRMPLGVDLGINDTGSDETGNYRLVMGTTWGKAFGLTDNVLRYEFTGDPTFDQLRVNSVSYASPLPWHHVLRVSGYYLFVNGDLGGGNTLEGNAYQASVRYDVPLPTMGKLQHEVSFGFDHKYNENDLFFGGTSAQNTPTAIFQVSLTYNASLSDEWGQTSFSAQGFYSPGDMSDLNSDFYFNQAQPLATANYAYARFNLERSVRLPYDYQFILRGMAQVSDANLLPSEQLGLGGFATVRGYEEREFGGARGWFFSGELRSPAFNPFRKVNWGELQLLSFVDYGVTENVDLLQGEEPRYVLLSTGVGLRYVLTRHFSARFDYGWQLVDNLFNVGQTSPQTSRAHFAIVGSY